MCLVAGLALGALACDDDDSSGDDSSGDDSSGDSYTACINGSGYSCSSETTLDACVGGDCSGCNDDSSACDQSNEDYPDSGSDINQ